MPRAVRIKYNPNKTERFPCSKRGVKELFRDFDMLDVYFERKSIFHSGRADGVSPDNIVAELFFMSAENEEWAPEEFGGNSGEPTLWIYTVKKERYNEAAVADFRETVCPALNDWLRNTLSERPAAGSKDSQAWVEWDGTRHKLDYAQLNT